MSDSDVDGSKLRVESGTAGAAVFAGSLDVMALTGQLWLGAVTPIGGLLLLAGWATLAFAALSRGAV